MRPASSLESAVPSSKDRVHATLVGTMASDRKLTRRRYSDADTAQMFAKCSQPGASLARMALALSTNAEAVHRRLQLAREDAPRGSIQQPEFLARPLAALSARRQATPPAPAADIRTEAQHGPLALCITWPTNATAEVASPDSLSASVRVASLWLAVEPLDMRAGTETALARVCVTLCVRRRPGRPG